MAAGTAGAALVWSAGGAWCDRSTLKQKGVSSVPELLMLEQNVPQARKHTYLFVSFTSKLRMVMPRSVIYFPFHFEKKEKEIVCRRKISPSRKRQKKIEAFVLIS
jgi:hypothetical protein